MLARPAKAVPHGRGAEWDTPHAGLPDGLSMRGKYRSWAFASGLQHHLCWPEALGGLLVSPYKDTSRVLAWSGDPCKARELTTLDSQVFLVSSDAQGQ